MSMKIERSTVDQVKARFALNKKKQEEKRKKSRPKPVLKVGDRVRLQDGKSVGSIDSIEKDKAIVNYGIFTTNVSVDQLELVEKGKKG